MKKMLEAVEAMGVEDGCLGGDVLQHEAGVPHRFGVGTLLLISTMYAVLFAVWRFIEGPPTVLVWVALFFFAVGLGQMLLFKGQRPRRASVIVGACVVPCMFLGYIVYEQLVTSRMSAFPIDNLCWLIPASAPMVEDIAEFWGRHFLGRGWKKQLTK